MKTIKIALIMITLMTLSLGLKAQSGPTGCSSVSNMLWTTTPWANVIQFSSANGRATFYTNKICGATSYLWMVESGASITTSSNSINLAISDLIWSPPGGCQEFNDNVINGVLHTTISARSNRTSFVTVPVLIGGVEKCKDPKTPKNPKFPPFN